LQTRTGNMSGFQHGILLSALALTLTMSCNDLLASGNACKADFNAQLNIGYSRRRTSANF
jgi:hypothetical protein